MTYEYAGAYMNDAVWIDYETDADEQSVSVSLADVLGPLGWPRRRNRRVQAISSRLHSENLRYGLAHAVNRSICRSSMAGRRQRVTQNGLLIGIRFIVDPHRVVHIGAGVFVGHIAVAAIVVGIAGRENTPPPAAQDRPYSRQSETLCPSKTPSGGAISRISSFHRTFLGQRKPPQTGHCRRAHL